MFNFQKVIDLDSMVDLDIFEYAYLTIIITVFSKIYRPSLHCGRRHGYLWNTKFLITWQVIIIVFSSAFSARRECFFYDYE